MTKEDDSLSYCVARLAYLEGEKAFKEGRSLEDNPYKEDEELITSWSRGFNYAMWTWASEQERCQKETGI